jgi:hypothetical protein
MEVTMATSNIMGIKTTMHSSSNRHRVALETIMDSSRINRKISISKTSSNHSKAKGTNSKARGISSKDGIIEATMVRVVKVAMPVVLEVSTGGKIKC